MLVMLVTYPNFVVDQLVGVGVSLCAVSPRGELLFCCWCPDRGRRQTEAAAGRTATIGKSRFGAQPLWHSNR
jgi:hypothetical protein